MHLLAIDILHDLQVIHLMSQLLNWHKVVILSMMKTKKNQITKYSFHPSSSLLLHEHNSPNQLVHEISLIHTSSDLWSDESFNLSILVVEVEKFGQVSDRDGCNSVRIGIIETNGSKYICTMHDLVQSSRCDFTILEIFGTFQEVETFQISLMVMLGYHNSDKPLELSQT